MSFSIDDSAFPLVRIRYPEQAELAQIEDYADRLDQVMRRGRIATVVDVRAVAVRLAGAEQRRYLAEQVDRVTTAHPGALVSESVVLNSAVLSAAYTAFNWLRHDRSYESRAFISIEGAVAWSREQLREAGLLED